MLVIFLIVIGGFNLISAFLLWTTGTTAIHEIQAGIGILVAVTCFIGAGALHILKEIREILRGKAVPPVIEARPPNVNPVK